MNGGLKDCPTIRGTLGHNERTESKALDERHKKTITSRCLEKENKYTNKGETSKRRPFSKDKRRYQPGKELSVARRGKNTCGS